MNTPQENLKRKLEKQHRFESAFVQIIKHNPNINKTYSIEFLDSGKKMSVVIYNNGFIANLKALLTPQEYRDYMKLWNTFNSYNAVPA